MCSRICLRKIEPRLTPAIYHSAKTEWNVKRRETSEERIARKCAMQLAASEESERRDRARAREQRVEDLATHIEWLEARGTFGLDDELIEPWRLW